MIENRLIYKDENVDIRNNDELDACWIDCGCIMKKKHKMRKLLIELSENLILLSAAIIFLEFKKNE